MGAVTGKGLSDLIREEFGLRTTFFLMIALVHHQFHQCHRGIRRHCQLARAVSHQPLYFSADLRRGGLVLGGARQLPQRRKDLSRRVLLVRHLYHFRISAEAGLEGSRHLQRQAHTDVRYRLHHHADRDGGHLHRALDAVLSAVGHRGEGNHRQGVRAVAHRSDRRLHFDRCGRVLHHRVLRHGHLGARSARISTMPPMPRWR